MKNEIIYLSVHCHHHENDSCVKMDSDVVTCRFTPSLPVRLYGGEGGGVGSDEGHLNVSLIVTDKVTRLCPQITTFLKRKEN